MTHHATFLGQTLRGAAVWTSIVLLASLLSAAAPAAADPAADPAADTAGDTTSRAARAKPIQKVLKRNRLNRIKTVGDAGCSAPASVAMDTTANLTAFYETELSCLQKTWRKQVKKAGVRFRSARVNV